MAQKKAGGSSKNCRDSAGRRLGFKHFGGESVNPGYIILRQRGTKFYPGAHVGMGKDHTLFILRWKNFVLKTPGTKICERLLGRKTATA